MPPGSVRTLHPGWSCRSRKPRTRSRCSLESASGKTTPIGDRRLLR
ncbi:MAG: hypothetical protein LBQ54_04830 [Planctomycetaceae bacterium]|nr:hypothetical protein [Planctomycetaceae bacterium]